MSETKKTKPDAFDEAMAEAGATDEAATITWHDLTLEMRPPSKWAFLLQYHARNGDLPGMIAAVFGEDGLRQVVESGHTDLDEITELLLTLQNGDAGNAQRPSSS